MNLPNILINPNYFEILNDSSIESAFHIERDFLYKNILNLNLSNKKILEVGCGPGDITKILVNNKLYFNYNSLYSVDSSKEIIMANKFNFQNTGYKNFLVDRVTVNNFYKYQDFDIFLFIYTSNYALTCDPSFNLWKTVVQNNKIVIVSFPLFYEKRTIKKSLYKDEISYRLKQRLKFDKYIIWYSENNLRRFFHIEIIGNLYILSKKK